MTKKHYLIFLLWKIKMYLKGYKKGSVVQIWSEEKKRFIGGFVKGFTGDSITEKKFGFDVWIRFIEPIEGNDSRFFTSGFYSESQLKEQKIKLIR